MCKTALICPTCDSRPITGVDVFIGAILIESLHVGYWLLIKGILSHTKASEWELLCRCWVDQRSLSLSRLCRISTMFLPRLPRMYRSGERYRSFCCRAHFRRRCHGCCAPISGWPIAVASVFVRVRQMFLFRGADKTVSIHYEYHLGLGFRVQVHTLIAAIDIIDLDECGH